MTAYYDLIAEHPVAAFLLLAALLAFWIWFGRLVRNWFKEAAQDDAEPSFVKVVQRRCQAIDAMTDSADRFQAAVLFYLWLNGHRRQFESKMDSQNESERQQATRMLFALQRACPDLRKTVIDWLIAVDDVALMRVARNLASGSFNDAVEPAALARKLREEIDLVRRQPQHLDRMWGCIIVWVGTQPKVVGDAALQG